MSNVEWLLKNYFSCHFEQSEESRNWEIKPFLRSPRYAMLHSVKGVTQNSPQKAVNNSGHEAAGEDAYPPHSVRFI